jgi:GDPmannose 4,6-dehydratase
MLQQDTPEDFVIATGKQHSVQTFVERAGARLGMRIGWRGEGAGEHGIDEKTGRTVVRIDPRYFRPTEVDTLLGDPSRALEKLGWKPELTFDQLVDEMVAEDWDAAKRDALVSSAGYKTYHHRE